jgi:hypothetical protein
MEGFIRTGSPETPDISLNPILGRLEFSGKSLPEDPATFFKPILAWIDEYLAYPVSKTDIEIKLDYFNTATSLVLMKVFNKFQEKKNVVVHWYHFPEDEDMLESGKEFQVLSKLNFEYHEFH